jgi:hypothetical protein
MSTTSSPTFPTTYNTATSSPPLESSADSTTTFPLPVVIYNVFMRRGATPWLVVPASGYALIALVSILLNGSIVYVTIRAKKSLRGTCPYLLALVSFLEVKDCLPAC